jgi:predicted NBD/HSP70 family sugar kinase
MTFTDTSEDGGRVLGLRIAPVDLLAVDPDDASTTRIPYAELAVYQFGLDGRPRGQPVPTKTIPGRKRDVLRAASELVNLSAEKMHQVGATPLALGVEIGGHVNGAGSAGRHRGEVLRSPNLGWDHPIDLAGQLHAMTGLVVVVENDVNALARFERWFGYGRSAEDFVVVMMGDGTGCALFSNGLLSHGATGMAGEIGHNPVAATEEEAACECWCRNRGCLDAIASGYGIMRRIRKSRYDGIVDSLNAEAFKADAFDLQPSDPHADRDAHRVFASAGRAIGRSLVALINAVDPSRIVLSGSVWWSSGVLQENAMVELVNRTFHAEGGVDREIETYGDDNLTKLARQTVDRWRQRRENARPEPNNSNTVPIFITQRPQWANTSGAAMAALLERVAGPPPAHSCD